MVLIPESHAAKRQNIPEEAQKSCAFLSGETEAESNSHCKNVINKCSASTGKEIGSAAICRGRLWGITLYP